MPLPLSSSEISMRQTANSEPIGKLPINSLISKVTSALKEVCLITGLKVEDQYSIEFVKVVSRFLRNHYNFLTPGEVALAFHLNAAGELPTKTVCFGSTLTLEHIGNVLYSYKQKRALLAAKLQELKAPEPEEKLTEEEIKQQEREFAQGFYERWLRKDLSPVSLSYAYMVYDTLYRSRVLILSPEEKKQWLELAESERQKELALPATDRWKKKEIDQIMDAYLNGAIPKEEALLIRNYAKRMALFNFFEKCRNEGKTMVI